MKEVELLSSKNLGAFKWTNELKLKIKKDRSSVSTIPHENMFSNYKYFSMESSKKKYQIEDFYFKL